VFRTLNYLPYAKVKDRSGDQRGGSECEPIKNSSRRRLKLQQDELARSDPQNHTLRTSTFCLPKPCSHWSATGPRANTTSNLNTRAPTTAETTRKPAVQRGRLDRVCGAVSTRQPRNPPKHLFREPKRTTVSPTKISSQGHASYQKILAKTKTSPRGLGAVRPATRGGLTSCTQQRTPNKNS
jgi:hypothetical protein